VDSASTTITVFPTPDASFVQNHEAEEYYVDEDTLSILNTSTGATHYLWTFGTTDTSNAYEPPYKYTQAGDYTIKLFAFSAQGCVDSAESPIQVRVREYIYVPNAFSPNDDKINDYFSVRTENIAELKIDIFNRWGRIFFSSNDVDFKWGRNVPWKPGAAGSVCLPDHSQGEERKRSKACWDT
jgi:PKD repeat protein